MTPGRTPDSPHVAIVIVSWGGREDTLSCLASLESVEWEPLTVIVVDNGSTDGTADAVRTRFPTAVLIVNSENVGGAEGMSIGIRHALARDADYVLLLDNDTEVDAGFVAPLVEEAEQRPDAGALCSLIYHADQPDVIWYAGARYNPRLPYNGKHVGQGERDLGQYRETRVVDYATACSVLIPCSVFARVGLFDSTLFVYCDDLEWSFRARRAGYRLYVVPRSKVWHKVSAVMGAYSATGAYYGLRNQLIVKQRYAGQGRARGLLRDVATLAIYVIHSRRSQEPRLALAAIVEAWRDYRAGRLGARGSIETGMASRCGASVARGE